jgi:peptide/nickel transport system substrate-binding protein
LEAGDGRLLEPHFQAGTIFEHIDFGIESAAEYAASRPDWFGDVRVRQAFVMCIDRQAMINNFLFGQAEIMHTYVPAIHPLYPEDLTLWPYDVEGAKALLEQAGYQDLDEDGLLEGPRAGERFEVTLFTTIGNELGDNVANAVAGNLADCGIEVEVVFLQGDVYFADGPEGPLFGRKFDLAAFPWLISIEPNCGLYLSSHIPGPENRWSRNANNETGFSQPEFDAACQAALDLLPGMEGYEASHQEALRIWTGQVPNIPLFLRPIVAATRPAILNFTLDPTQESELWNLYELDVES